jgi:hypothetical protein
MKVWAVWLLTVITMEALFNFEIVRMELLLFPTMTKGTSVFLGASILVGSNEIFCFPI